MNEAVREHLNTCVTLFADLLGEIKELNSQIKKLTEENNRLNLEIIKLSFELSEKDQGDLRT